MPDQVTKTDIHKLSTPKTMVSIQNTYYDTQPTSVAERLEKAIFVYPIKSLLPLQLYELWLLHNETSLKKCFINEIIASLLSPST